MATTTMFACGSCGREEPKWLGHCPSCGEWNTFEPRAASLARSIGGNRQQAAAQEAQPITNISVADANPVSSGIGELDRAIGGGFVPGSTLLLGGDPGVGKSTLLLQAAAALAGVHGPALYASAPAYSGEAFQGFRWKVTTAGVRGVISLAEMKW